MGKDLVSRKDFLIGSLSAAVAAAIPTSSGAQQTPTAGALSVEDLKAFQKVVGLSFTDDELKAALPEVRAALAQMNQARKTADPDYRVESPATFHVDGLPSVARKTRASTDVRGVKRPAKAEDLAFLTLAELSALLRERKVTSLELTEIYLERLKRIGPKLECVVTLLEDSARDTARRRDRELRDGAYRGPLHGIPYGVKDLLSKAGFPTTWGAAPYRSQVFDHDAAVIERLEAAGAVLLAKTSVGALAYNNIWFGGKTKNPWNLERGSSGSSAGSGAGMAAGLFAFAIGTETLGSIMSPSLECRVTGLRPTYGRVSRYGCMSLSYTMDKIGPMCRTAQDAALVFAAMHGLDPRDAATKERPFEFRPRRDLKGITIGVLSAKPEDWGKDPVLTACVKLGAELKEAKVPAAPPEGLLILDAEGASNFDELTRSGRVNEIQESIWPNGFRAARFVPAVEYLRAMRRRAEHMAEWQSAMAPYDFLFDVGIGNGSIVQTNLTGNPQVLIPLLPNERNLSQGRSFIGKLWDEATILSAAWAVQRELGHFRLRPDVG